MISEITPVNAATRINQNSSDVEYFTDLKIVQLAREVMGGSIDLDPASSEIANKGIGARGFFSVADDGIMQDWFGNVWLNWPFGRAEPPCEKGCIKRHVHHSYELYGNQRWCNKLIGEFTLGNFEQCCAITYACTSEKWFTQLLKQPQCFLVPRTNYFTPDGKVKRGVTKGSVVTYFGPNVNRFAQKFSALGVVKIPYSV